MSQSIKVIQMEEETYLFLLHVLESYAQRGMPMKNLGAAAELSERVFAAQTLTNDLGKATLEPTPTGVALEIDAS
jgi:hypothetical protein